MTTEYPHSSVGGHNEGRLLEADLDDVLGAVVAAVCLGLPRVALGQTPRALPARHGPLRAHPAPLLPPTTTTSSLLFSPLPSWIQRTDKNESDSPARRTHPQILGSRQRSREIGRAHRPTSPPYPCAQLAIQRRDDGGFGSPVAYWSSESRKSKWEEDETKWAAFLSSPYSLKTAGPLGVSGHQITGRVLV